jgi:hypothetical protein
MEKGPMPKPPPPVVFDVIKSQSDLDHLAEIITS